MRDLQQLAEALDQAQRPEDIVAVAKEIKQVVLKNRDYLEAQYRKMDLKGTTRVSMEMVAAIVRQIENEQHLLRVMDGYIAKYEVRSEAHGGLDGKE
jgi:hypothetical protein